MVAVLQRNAVVQKQWSKYQNIDIFLKSILLQDDKRNKTLHKTLHHSLWQLYAQRLG